MQKKLFDQFLHQRILMQKLLTTANRLPAHLDAFTKVRPSVVAARRDLKGYVKDSVKLQKALFELSETAIEVEEPQDDDLFEAIDGNFGRMLPFVEDTIEKWASRTQILKGKAHSKSIIEQVYSLMNEAGNKAKMLERSRTGKDKVFGLLPSEQMALEDRDVYNDNEFYQALLKDFLASNEGDQQAQGATGEDDIYVDGADLNLTQRALERKRRLQETAGPKKEVDRRASKNRKIRYVVHEKLVNFMTPVDNTALVDGSSVLQSLFG